MLVAVVTPYLPPCKELQIRCNQSVINQTYQNIKHIFVADGLEDDYEFPSQTALRFDRSHNDAGATPRALGALHAFSSGVDAVAFLDVDNTFEPTHIENLVNLLINTGADLITATRNICDRYGKRLYVDTEESDGITFCDTNCYLLSRKCMHLLSAWIVTQSNQLWSDRFFWRAIQDSNLSRVHSTIPGVNYYSRWAWHYQYAGLEPPPTSVWIHKENGILRHVQHQEYQKGSP